MEVAELMPHFTVATKVCLLPQFVLIKVVFVSLCRIRFICIHFGFYSMFELGTDALSQSARL